MSKSLGQQGEATLFGVFIVFIASGLLLITSMELRKNFLLLKKRTELFLCVKETHQKIDDYLVVMGRTNWAIKNITRAAVLAVFIPGLQAVALNAPRAKKIIQLYQEAYFFAYLKSLHALKTQGCPIDPRLVITPFYHIKSYRRNLDGTAKLRKAKWDYQFYSAPYLLSMSIDAYELENLNPKIKYNTTESGAKSSWLLSLRY
jgi:hypothetical protein